MTQNRDDRGSKARCLKLTGLPRADAAQMLTNLMDGKGEVTLKDEWVPEGPGKPLEAMVHRTVPKFPLINNDQRTQVLEWWLHKQSLANTPNWDIVSSCTIGDKAGLLLVEAKAHTGELSDDGKGTSGNIDNHEQIGRAIDEANRHLKKLLPGWALNRNHSYQMANRFAWAWKFADMGIPVVLVYMGFLNATEMERGLFLTPADWDAYIHRHADPFVPAKVWGQLLDVNGTPLIPLIRSLDL